jgi:hypothetical protein
LKIVVGDFAGVENVFTCEDDLTLNNFMNVKRDKKGDPVPFYSGELIDRDSVQGGKPVEIDDTCEASVLSTEDAYRFATDISNLPSPSNKRRKYKDTTRENLLKTALDGEGKESRYDAMVTLVVDQVAKNASKSTAGVLSSSSEEVETMFKSDTSPSASSETPPPKIGPKYELSNRVQSYSAVFGTGSTPESVKTFYKALLKQAYADQYDNVFDFSRKIAAMKADKDKINELTGHSS